MTTNTLNTGAASLSDERERAAITACALMIKGICLTRPNAEWTGAIEDRIQFMLKQMQAGAAIAAGGAQEANAWQPIETAPRDGTNIIIRFGRDGVSQAKYVVGTPHPWKFIDTNDGITWLINHAVDTEYGPTHWMPMHDATPLPRVATPVMPDDTSAFKNFHRQLCERFGYVHDEKDWRRDRVSLIEWIAKRLAPAAPSVEQDERGALTDEQIGEALLDTLVFKLHANNDQVRRFRDAFHFASACDAMLVDVEEVKQLCRDFSSRTGSVYIKDVESALDGIASRAASTSANVAQGDALSAVADDIASMSADELRAEHESHRNGDIAAALRELSANVAQGAEAELEFMPVDSMQHAIVYGSKEAIASLKARMERDYRIASLPPAPPTHKTLTDDARDAARWRKLVEDGAPDIYAPVVSYQEVKRIEKPSQTPCFGWNDTNHAEAKVIYDRQAIREIRIRWVDKDDDQPTLLHMIDAALTAAQSASGETKP